MLIQTRTAGQYREIRYHVSLSSFADNPELASDPAVTRSEGRFVVGNRIPSGRPLLPIQSDAGTVVACRLGRRRATESRASSDSTGLLS